MLNLSRISDFLYHVTVSRSRLTPLSLSLLEANSSSLMIASCCYVVQSYSIVFSFLAMLRAMVLRDIFTIMVSTEFFEALSSLVSIYGDDATDLFQPSGADCGRLSLCSQSGLNNQVRDLYLPSRLLNCWLPDCTRKDC